MALSRRKYTSCKSLLYTPLISGSYCLLSCSVFFACTQPGQRSPLRRRITHQLYNPRHLPCMNSSVAASCSLTSILIFLHRNIVCPHTKQPISCLSSSSEP